MGILDKYKRSKSVTSTTLEENFPKKSAEFWKQYPVYDNLNCEDQENKDDTKEKPILKINRSPSEPFIPSLPNILQKGFSNLKQQFTPRKKSVEEVIYKEVKRLKSYEEKKYESETDSEETTSEDLPPLIKGTKSNETILNGFDDANIKLNNEIQFIYLENGAVITYVPPKIKTNRTINISINSSGNNDSEDSSSEFKEEENKLIQIEDPSPMSSPTFSYSRMEREVKNLEISNTEKTELFNGSDTEEDILNKEMEKELMDNYPDFCQAAETSKDHNIAPEMYQHWAETHGQIMEGANNDQRNNLIVSDMAGRVVWEYEDTI
ncbi:MAG TPA: hypothetical protein QKA08_01305 [Candidatus Megaira endosymbiont of Nemacystus decipiens]|nr:hypothetical protein [Candidatus Megaera endosymbiont of Nemacystus decipiens]